LSFYRGLGGFGQTVAARVAFVCVWRRNRRRLLRTVPVLAAGGCLERWFRLANCVDELCRPVPHHAAAVARTCDTTHGGLAERRSVAVPHASPVGSSRASFLPAPRIGLLHLRLPARLHYDSHAGLPHRQSPLRRRRRPHPRGH